MKYLTGLIFVENAVAREIFDFSRPFWRSAEVIERPTTCDVLAGERDVEVVVELRVVRRDERKFPAHAPAYHFNLVDRRPRHHRVTDVAVLKMDKNAFEMVDFQTLGRFFPLSVSSYFCLPLLSSFFIRTTNERRHSGHLLAHFFGLRWQAQSDADLLATFAFAEQQSGDTSKLSVCLSDLPLSREAEQRKAVWRCASHRTPKTLPLSKRRTPSLATDNLQHRL